MKFNEQCNAINRQHQLQADYEKTVALLRALKTGEVSLAQVTMTADGWTFAETPPVPAALPPSIAERLVNEPAASNGNGDGSRGDDHSDDNEI